MQIYEQIIRIGFVLEMVIWTQTTCGANQFKFVIDIQ